jgi:hypothetical protein
MEVIDLEVSLLKAAAEDALSRGFAIMACMPHEKNPYTKYSPHACNSATRNPSVALLPWVNGEEANYGVSCGASNLTVVDVDHGIADAAQFEAWKHEFGIPETFTVQSGREGEAGFHMYFSGAVKTCGFEIGGVTGELKGLGGYVVGPGSIHPSGNKYTIYKEVDVVPLPPGLAAMAAEKKKIEFLTKQEGGELIKVNTRWIHGQTAAGKLRNAGLDEEGIYEALKRWYALNCEDGENYPDEKIKEQAHAATHKFDAMESGPIVTVGSPDPEDESGIPELSLNAIEGDYLGDLSIALTKGTFIPPSFARATLKTMTGSVLDGIIGFPNEETLHMRHWTALVSARPEAGKSVIWDRCLLFLKPLLEKHGIIFPPSGFFSSGEHAIRTLAENDGKSHLAYFDEMKGLFEKGSGTGSTLFSRLLELYEQKAAGVGSIASSKASFNNVGLNMTGGFTRDGYERSISGKSAGGNGFLSRMVMEYSNGINHIGDWAAMNPEAINTAVVNIQSSIQWIGNHVGEVNKGKPFIPEETEDANAARVAFQLWVDAEKKRIQKDSSDAGYASRLEAHFKRDLLLRAAFSPDRRITKELVDRSVAWAKHQLFLREALWPVDSGGDVEKFEKRIVAAIRKFGPLTKAGVQKFSNADKCSGGYEAWNRAWQSVLRAEKISVSKHKSNRGKEKFGFEDMVWSKAKQEWQGI